MMNIAKGDSIVAVSTASGVGGIAVVRISGEDALKIADCVWRGKSLVNVPSHTAHFGRIISEETGDVVDEAVATVFRAPKSFTGEDTVEFSIHGSRWIQKEVIRLLTDAGARPAGPGEFSQRAFMNGRLDLAQAEGVADLIAASSRAAHRLAMTQLNGQFSGKLNQLRDRLVDFASLLELELDFSEEDVEFADRQRLIALAEEILVLLRRLVSSYAAGKSFKEGIPVVIAGVPNAGKSTLLNYLLEEDKAIVSAIPGTTRDIIEDTHEIGGVLFRFIDTAGIRDTEDAVEKIGIERALQKMDWASIILWMIDSSSDLESQILEINRRIPNNKYANHIILLNKSDLNCTIDDKIIKEKILIRDSESINADSPEQVKVVRISAKTGEGIDTLKEMMRNLAICRHNPDNEIIVTNERHYVELRRGAEAIERSLEGLKGGISADFISQDVREALHHIGMVTGSVTTDTLLFTIFSRFCIGK